MVHIQLIDIGLQLSYYCHMPNKGTHNPQLQQTEPLAAVEYYA